MLYEGRSSGPYLRPSLGFFSLSAVVDCCYRVEVAMFAGPCVLFCQQVFCCLPLVSLKLTPWGFINWSCQSGLCAWGLYSRFVCLTSVGRLLIKKKKKMPGAVEKLTQCRKRSLIFQSHWEASCWFHQSLYVCVYVSWRSSLWHRLIFLVIWPVLFPQGLILSNLLVLLTPFLWRNSSQCGQ